MWQTNAVTEVTGYRDDCLKAAEAHDKAAKSVPRLVVGPDGISRPRDTYRAVASTMRSMAAGYDEWINKINDTRSA